MRRSSDEPLEVINMPGKLPNRKLTRQRVLKPFARIAASRVR